MARRKLDVCALGTYILRGAASRKARRFWRAEKRRGGGVLSHIYTLVIVILAWVIFRAENVGAGLKYIGAMFGLGAAGFIDSAFIEYVKNTAFILIAALIGATPLLSNIIKRFKAKGLTWIEYAWLFIVFALSLIEVVCSTYNPFIYFNF